MSMSEEEFPMEDQEHDDDQVALNFEKALVLKNTTTSSSSSNELINGGNDHHHHHKKRKMMNEKVDEYPIGYRFCPHDHELLLHYLKNKIFNLSLPHNNIKDVNLYRHNPKDLAEKYQVLGEKEWYFFTPRDRKYRNGTRPNRAAGNGYWKATGADRCIKYKGEIVGHRKALVFYEGKPPKGEKTNWIMHEYRISDAPVRAKTSANDMRLDDWVLCRIYKKAGKGKSGKEGEEDEAEPVGSSNEEVEPIAMISNDHLEMSGGDSSRTAESELGLVSNPYNFNNNYVHVHPVDQTLSQLPNLDVYPHNYLHNYANPHPFPQSFNYGSRPLSFGAIDQSILRHKYLARFGGVTTTTTTHENPFLFPNSEHDFHSQFDLADPIYDPAMDSLLHINAPNNPPNQREDKLVGQY